MLNSIQFTVEPHDGYNTIQTEWTHIGVVGSGDLEVLLRRKDSSAVDVKITTPVTGFDDIWKAVLTKAVVDASVGGISIEINDNNATPFIVATRLRQGFIEAGIGGGR
jgi:malonate decarboxylase delta subunit